MEIKGIVWEDEDGCWCLEVDEAQYRETMGEENWAVERAMRNQFPDEHLPWTIALGDLLMQHGILSGNTVQFSIDIQKLKGPKS